MKKSIYELLGHDTYIYGYGFNSEKHELYFDVDIFKNSTSNNNYMYKVYPATIVFKNVWDITIEISNDNDIIISQVEAVYCGIPRNGEYINYKKEYVVNIECLQGSISFKTVGGVLVQKGEEVILDETHIGISSKRPISFCMEGNIVEFTIKD